MKLVFPLGSLLLCLPSLGMAADMPAQHDQVQAAVMVVPAELPEQGPRGPLRLRDALRHSVSDSDTETKPYRLSTEERQRLREQLRSQSFDDASRK